MTTFLWIVQIIVDGLLVAALWKLLQERGLREESTPLAGEEPALRAEDFEEYHEAMSELCDRMGREAELWTTRLEQKTRLAKQLVQRFDEGTPKEATARPVSVPVEEPPKAVAAHRPAPRVQHELASSGEVMRLRAEGLTPEQIAQRLGLGQSEVQLMLSMYRQR